MNMLNLPPKFILFDTEFTSWEGSQERKWSGEGEHKEIVQIGAIMVDNADLTEKSSFLSFVKPKINPKLSEYFTNLTGIAQSDVNEKGVDLQEALQKFKEWGEDLPMYCFGRDGLVVKGNCELINIEFPFKDEQFNNIREFFNENGVPTEGYYSSTIVEAFGAKPMRVGHDALNDARTILDGLVLLEKKLADA